MTSYALLCFANECLCLAGFCLFVFPFISGSNLFFKIIEWGTSLVVQWLRIHLPMQGTQVRALVQEDHTCHRATKPVHHNYWACALEPKSHNCWAPAPQLLKPVSPRAHALQILSPRTATAEPTHHNYWSPCPLGPTCRNYWARVLQLLRPVRLEPMLRNKRSHREATTMRSPCTATKSSPRLPQLEKAHMQQRRPSAANR